MRFHKESNLINYKVHLGSSSPEELIESLNMYRGYINGDVFSNAVKFNIIFLNYFIIKELILRGVSLELIEENTL